MPELPEVETMRRGIEPCLQRRIVDVEIVRCKRRPINIAPRGTALRRRLVGRTIVETSRAGKRVVVILDSGDRLVFEPRMTGLVLLADPPTAAHLRLRLRLSGHKGAKAKTDRGCDLMYWDRRGLGSVRLMSPAEYDAAFSDDRLGPDALVATADSLQQRLAESRRAIKVALLDQRAVAGIGNLYAAEILHMAELHPAISCRRLKSDDWHRLAAATRKILKSAIRYEGSTLSDGTYRNALNESGSYQNHHKVYARAGEPCRRC
ncbi:MAG: formamidopyrimidine-DNA glycosylase, partial [Planctomycetia bacterium]|nr:formamidopyrimidine-DNA glycosylase [Planctomycetia bacterium]